jgi:hypothetical protein
MSESGKMNIGINAGPPATDAAVESHDIVLRRIGPHEFKEHERELREFMQINALNKKEGKELSAREDEVTGMYDRYFSSGKNGRLYVATEGEKGKIIAFVGLYQESSTEVAVDQIRLSSKKGGVLKTLLKDLSNDLRKEGILRCSIDLDEDASSMLDSKEDNDWFKKFYILRRSEGAKESPEETDHHL